MTILDHLRELIAYAEKSKKFGPNSVATKHLKEQLEREEGMIKRGRYGPNPDRIRRPTRRP